jgi:TPP-dependent pyruvate/acetoin dehydrogenase alpha subunit
MGLINEAEFSRMGEEVGEEIARITAQADSDPHPDLQDRFDDVLAEKYPYQPW